MVNVKSENIVNLLIGFNHENTSIISICVKYQIYIKLTTLQSIVNIQTD